MSNKRSDISKRILASKEYAEGLVTADTRNAIAFQLSVMQEERGWTQQELADRAGMGQSQISSYLNGYDSYSVATLRKLASAFDVSLVVSFEAFSKLADRLGNRTERDFAIPSRLDDRALRDQATHTLADWLSSWQSSGLTRFPNDQPAVTGRNHSSLGDAATLTGEAPKSGVAGELKYA